MPAPTLAPWLSLPRVETPIQLIDAPGSIDDLFDLPDGSTLSVAAVDMKTGNLHTIRWRDTGEVGFYPASTIKWITAAMAVDWMDQHGMGPETVIQLGDERPATLRELILSCLIQSDNEAFNTLQESVGFAETYAAMKRWGVEHSMIRRHFTRPHWNHSRPIKVFFPDGKTASIAERPAADIPLNLDPRPAPLGNPEANYFTSDDFVICGAATLMGKTRDATCFPLLTEGLGWTNQNYVREGLTQLTGELDRRPAFATLTKPGWWPGDGANSELVYVYDASHDRHYFVGIYTQGTNDDARVQMNLAARKVFGAIHRGELDLLAGV